MAKGYWIGRLDVTDPEKFKAYSVAAAEAWRKYGGRFLVRGGSFESMEGSSRARNVVIEFDDYVTALGLLSLPRICQGGAAPSTAFSSRYHRDRRIRRAAADCDVRFSAAVTRHHRDAER
jgi:uncharacterized protein (DUF1330 family)